VNGSTLFPCGSVEGYWLYRLVEWDVNFKKRLPAQHYKVKRLELIYVNSLRN